MLLLGIGGAVVLLLIAVVVGVMLFFVSGDDTVADSSTSAPGETSFAPTSPSPGTASSYSAGRNKSGET